MSWDMFSFIFVIIYTGLLVSYAVVPLNAETNVFNASSGFVTSAILEDRN